MTNSVAYVRYLEAVLVRELYVLVMLLCVSTTG